GILSGLGAAFGQALSYLATRNYVQRRATREGASRQLTVLAHVWMGLFAIILLPFCWPGAGIWNGALWAQLLPAHVLNVVFYTSGMLFMMTALKHAEASRVGPLMTSKLIMASILVMCFGQPVGDTTRFLTPMRWVAVAMCLAAGLAISLSGGRMKVKALLAIGAAASSYGVSDYGINLTIKSFLTVPGVTAFQASLLTQVLIYLTFLLIGLLLLGWCGSRDAVDWRDAMPFAVTWFGAMVGLFTAFALVGILLGTILQCTRGFITILLAAVVMKLGHHHIEPHASRGVVVRRLAAGLMMFVGIAMYVLKDWETVQGIFKR
ncbi:MAG: hypothetical protein ABIP94_09680, partial [Planctomycetota bacterium]